MLNLLAEEEKSMQKLITNMHLDGKLAEQANCGRAYFARRSLQL